MKRFGIVYWSYSSQFENLISTLSSFSYAYLRILFYRRIQRNTCLRLDRLHHCGKESFDKGLSHTPLKQMCKPDVKTNNPLYNKIN